MPGCADRPSQQAKEGNVPGASHEIRELIERAKAGGDWYLAPDEIAEDAFVVDGRVRTLRRGFLDRLRGVVRAARVSGMRRSSSTSARTRASARHRVRHGTAGRPGLAPTSCSPGPPPRTLSSAPPRSRAARPSARGCRAVTGGVGGPGPDDHAAADAARRDPDGGRVKGPTTRMPGRSSPSPTS